MDAILRQKYPKPTIVLASKTYSLIAEINNIQIQQNTFKWRSDRLDWL